MTWVPASVGQIWYDTIRYESRQVGDRHDMIWYDMIWYVRGSLIGVLCYIPSWPKGRLFDLIIHMHLTLLKLCVKSQVWILRVLTYVYYTYLLLYIQGKWQYQLSITCYLYHEVHWFCFWDGNYPLSVWLLKPSIIPFFPRYTDVEDHRACCYFVLICVKLWSAPLCSCTCVSSICNLYLTMYEYMYVISSMEESCIVFIWVAL